MKVLSINPPSSATISTTVSNATSKGLEILIRAVSSAAEFLFGPKWCDDDETFPLGFSTNRKFHPITE